MAQQNDVLWRGFKFLTWEKTVIAIYTFYFNSPANTENAFICIFLKMFYFWGLF
jgi:hypothetical protein